MKKRYLTTLVAGILLSVSLAACTSEEADEEAISGEEAISQEDQVAAAPTEDQGVERQIQVGPILVECEGEGPQECMLIREDEMDKWQLWYSPIEGFQYEEGFLYDLLIEEQTVENPPAGGSSIKWVLKEELGKTPVTTRTLIVGPEQVDCEGEGPQLCYLVKENPEDDWQYFYSEIDGFQFEQGYDYVLQVAEIPVENPPAGASSIQYLLVEVESKKPAEKEEEEQVDIDGTIWAATTINGQPVIDDSEILLGIAPDRIGGFTGCNTYFGPVESEGNSVAVGPLGSTRIACLEDIGDQERDYLAALESAATVDIEEDQMMVYDDAGEMILTFIHVEPLPLEDTLWELTTYNNGENAMVSVLPDTLITAEFVDGQLSGSGGCNSYFGPYEATEDTIKIGLLASTMMACAEPINEQEHLYLAALESAATYQVIANRLELINTDGALAAMYHAAEPVELSGTSWNVIAHNNGRGGVTSVIIGTELTVNFDEEMVSGLAGCNNYNGGYETEGEAINIGPLATTRKFCSEPEGTMDQESEFLAALEGSTRYEIVGQRMDMFLEDGARAMTLERIQ